jgi:hypothetical protein
MVEALRSSETSVFTRATLYDILEDDIVRSHGRGNLRAYDVSGVPTLNVPSLPNLVTLMTEAIPSSERSVLRRATRCKIPEDANLHILTLATHVSAEVQPLEGAGPDVLRKSPCALCQHRADRVSGGASGLLRTGNRGENCQG